MGNCYDKIPQFTDLIFKYFERDDRNISGKNAKFICPFHKETEPSFSIDIENGVYKCFGCNKSGNIITLVQHMEGFSTTREANRFILEYYGEKEDEPVKKKKEPDLPNIDPNIIKEYIRILESSHAHLRNRLKEDWGINDETITSLELGCDGERITIPIKDTSGNYINVRKYKFDTPGKDKVISYKTGYGKAALYPISNLSGKEIWICEGEKDCITAISRGLNAITGTCGAGTFAKEWIPLFTDKIIYIVYDNDEAGNNGAKKISNILKDFAESVTIINLDVSEEKEDLTDYFNKYNKTVNDLRNLISLSQQPLEHGEIDVRRFERVHLSHASHAEYFNKAIEMDCMITGKLQNSHLPPKTVRVSCPGGMDKCKYCKIAHAGGEIIHEYKPNFGKILNLISCSDSQQIGWIRKDVGVPEKCKVAIEKVNVFNIEEIQLSPKLELSDAEYQYVNAKAYYIGHDIIPNKSYTMKGYTIPSPKDNTAVHVILEAKPDQFSLSGYSIENENIEELKAFQAPANPKDPMDTTSIENKINDIVRMFENGVTRIYGRQDLHEAVDLVFHSTISFMFNNQMYKKGWLDVLIMGDPRTGKNKVSEGLMNYYGIRSKASGENLSYAGLVGGIDGSKDNQFVKWGMLPQNDKAFLLIDELSGISTDMIGKLSSIRDEGECSVLKIKGAATMARTRLLCLSNPRNGGSVKQTAYGVQQIRELIGKDEDVARFDYAMVLSGDDVDSGLINRLQEQSLEFKYSKELCRKLIRWAWSRRSGDILFDRNATSVCLDYAKLMGKTYSDSMKLVQSGNIAFKLAKIAVAYAIRTFNTYDGATVVIEPRHIVMAYKLLRKLYDHPSMKYDKYSENERINSKIVREADLKELFLEFRNKDLLDIFLNKIMGEENEIFTHSDIRILIGESATKYGEREIMSILYKCNAIEKQRGGYRKTKAFNSWLHKYRYES